MDGSTRIVSDDETIPDVKLSAVTEALLASSGFTPSPLNKDRPRQNVQPDSTQIDAVAPTPRETGFVVPPVGTEAYSAVAAPPPLNTAAVDRTIRISGKRKVRRVIVNGQPFTIMRKLGKGGSGRVYQVVSERNHLLAMKAVSLTNMDAQARKQLQDEVNLLGSLSEEDRVVNMRAWSIDEKKNCLYMIMELGQCDLDTLWKEKLEQIPELDLVFVGYYWLEMLKCVAQVHRLDIVHSDLKPANFILVYGQLKLADFGIAHAIPDDTLNIYEEHLSGTPNYMAPESLKLGRVTNIQVSGDKAFRFGKPSDVWSLGVILYLMTYGRQPFAHIRGLGPKVMAICDPKHIIEYPREGLGGVTVPLSYIRTMKACLSRDAKKRPTATELLRNVDGLLSERVATDNTVYVTSASVEKVLDNALREAGTGASAAELKEWSEQLMEVLKDEHTTE